WATTCSPGSGCRWSRRPRDVAAGPTGGAMSPGAPAGPLFATEPEETTVLADSPAFSGFSVDDLDRARRFYEDTLGLRLSDAGMGGVARLQLGGGTEVVVYAKGEAHAPATFTVLNFPVPDVEKAVDALTERG